LNLFVDHFGLVVRSLEESIPFYTAIFGPPVQRVSWRGKDAEYVAKMVAHPGLELDAAFFQLPFTQSLMEMIEYRGVKPTNAKLDPMQVSATHLGLFVENLDKTMERLRALGVTFRSEPIDIPYGPYKGGRSIYFTDPNGMNLQLMQLVGRPGQIPVPPDASKATS
jgi:catechol 2,3-dioxygenase-like lactoylglutathione lyase family enzyme